MQIVQSLGDAIDQVLPNGTNYGISHKILAGANPPDPKFGQWQFVPNHAPDLFAVCAHICRIGGVIGYFDPSPYAKTAGTANFKFSPAQRKEIDKLATTCRDAMRNVNGGAAPKELQNLWENLILHWDKPVTPGSYTKRPKSKPTSAPWWPTALKLLMISDMVCERIGKDPIKELGTDQGKLDIVLSALYAYEPGNSQVKSNGEKAKIMASAGPASIGLMSDTSVACVMPKIRVAAVGATVRNASRNLAYLPGRGEVRCAWDITGEKMPSEDNDALDILLIPLPFTLRGQNFVPHSDDGVKDSEKHRTKRNWENFDLKQDWLGRAGSNKRKELVRTCCNLLKQAKKDSRVVNGVIFPELALDYANFEVICDALKEIEERLEFVIAGSSKNCVRESANTLLTRVWTGLEKDVHVTNSRKKHHRWRVTRSQIEQYAIGAALNPKIQNWWENTPVGRRELHFHRFRRSSVFATLICEELARSDPCHEILRSVAPNLVFALLMDGPQIKQRWPAQYASNLADDPGTSVLTFTSYGLIERVNNTEKFPKNHSVALWRDDGGNFVEIPMPTGKGPRGILLSLWAEHVQDMTIVGKLSLARAWRYSSHYPVLLED